MRRQFWAAVLVGCTSAVLAAMTLISREWIEFFFGVDPDNGSGGLEWAIVIVTAVTAVTCLGWATVEWRRAPGDPVSRTGHG